MSQTQEPQHAGELATALVEKLQRTCSESAAYWNSPEGQERRRTQQREEHQRKVDELRSDWNAPERQLQRKDLNRAGPWGDALAKLKLKLGTGMLVGLCGTRGPGKTQLGVELMRECTRRLRSARYETTAGFLMKIKGTYRSDSTQTEEDVLNRYGRYRLVVLDEISKRAETGWEDRLLNELIDLRYREMRDTLLIANQDKATFLSAVGPSIASRMSECGGIIECNWKSFRS